MHPFVQAVLVVGVLALVGIGGYVAVYGVPERQAEVSSLDRLKAATAAARDTRCRLLLARDRSELNQQGRIDLAECMVQN